MGKRHPHKKAFDLCKDLGQHGHIVLFVLTPMAVDADSVDVEKWIIDHWQGGEINDSNFRIPARAFLEWWRSQHE